MKTSIDKNFVTIDNNTKAKMDFIKTERLSLVNLKLIDDTDSEYKLRLATHSRDAFYIDSVFGKDKVNEKVSIDDIKDIISNIKDVVNNITDRFSLTLKTDDSNKHIFNVYKSDDENCIDFIVNYEGTGLFVTVKKENNMMMLFDKFLKSIE